MAAMHCAGFALLLLSIPAIADSPPRVVTVSQLEQELTEAGTHHLSDLETVEEISSAGLSERLSDQSLTRLQTLVDARSQAATALQLLADQSLFLKLPPAELTDTSVPDSEARQQILKAAVDYVRKLLSTLPNLLATRTTTSYSDGIHSGKNGVIIVGAGLRKIRTSSLEVSIRNDGIDTSNKDPKLKRRNQGMSSRGEFGSLLAIILSDSTQGKVYWSHWEPSPTGQLAVFDFEVPKSASHYSFDDSHGVRKPGYHGSLWIDPVSGAISRAFLKLEPDAEISYVRFGTMVQYGPVKIDDQTFNCPVRSVAMEEYPVFSRDAAKVRPNKWLGKWLNETTFINYRRFGSTANIITSPEKTEPAKPAQDGPN
jgi:hypothetical protein